MKYLKIYNEAMIPCGVIDMDGSFPSEPSNLFAKAYDNDGKFVGVLELGTELTDSQSSLTVHLYDENLNLCGNVPAHIIEKDVPNPNIILTPSSFTYSGEPCVPTVVVKDGDTVVPTSEYTVEITNNVNAGTALVTITDKVGGDYKVSGTTTFQIAKAAPVYTAPTGKSDLEYTGEAQALLNAGSTENGTFKYSLDGTTWSENVPTGTEAQTYTVYWKLDGDANHSDVAQSTISVEIESPVPAESVDLGLPSGKKWAIGNLVKDSQGNYSIGEETDWGTYVSWGNIDGHNDGEGYTFDGTTYDSTPGQQVAADIPSNDAAHDIALATLGTPWHLPTKEDFQELYDNTDSEWVADYNGTGVAGWKFMKKSDHSVYVFFPASGNGGEGRNTGGNYWSSSFDNRVQAHCLYFYRLNPYNSSVEPEWSNNRFGGLTVRPVQ